MPNIIVLVMFQRFRLLLRWQERRKEAWFRLLLVRIYTKNICRIEIFKFNFKPTLFEEVTRGNKWQTPKGEKTQIYKHYQYIRQLDLYKVSVYYAIVTVMFQWFRLLLRWQEGRKEAWFRLLLVSRKKKCRYFFLHFQRKLGEQFTWKT